MGRSSASRASSRAPATAVAERPRPILVAEHRRPDAAPARPTDAAKFPTRSRPPLTAPLAILPSASLCALVAVVSMLAVDELDLTKELIRATYVGAALVILPLAVTLWAGLSLAEMALRREPQPMRRLAEQLRDRAPMLLLPVIILPLFMAAFTINKSAIPLVVGFGWDGTFARWDAALLGQDAWRLTHRLIGGEGSELLEVAYTVLWGIALAFVPPLVALLGSRAACARFTLAVILTWTLGGLVAAAMFSSAGPAFAQLSDPALGAHFAPLRASLDGLLPADSLVRETQAYLSSVSSFRFVIRGGGISAMPSMHVAVAALYCLSAKGTHLIWPAAAFWALIMLGSVHFGYHYLVDGITGTLIAALCWRGAARWFGRYGEEARVPSC